MTLLKADEAAEGDDVAEETVDDEENAEEPVTEAVKTTVWDKLVGYYQQVATAYNSFLALIKK